MNSTRPPKKSKEETLTEVDLILNDYFDQKERELEMKTKKFEKSQNLKDNQRK